MNEESKLVVGSFVFIVLIVLMGCAMMLELNGLQGIK